ncbi:hypothetical protein KV697_14165 [Sphingomonas sanguinis]|uniref:hypothetical protein n=1 Tax=Sphingomonas sanguinis TaxID=33051 RepID=UPI001C59AA1A|nr:hypothetical protein [Sphingomonas sanguinis]QXT34915.1 hypothetical protein KV697_14165 [Sphingomonas sanguinis]
MRVPTALADPKPASPPGAAGGAVEAVAAEFPMIVSRPSRHPPYRPTHEFPFASAPLGFAAGGTAPVDEAVPAREPGIENLQIEQARASLGPEGPWTCTPAPRPKVSFVRAIGYHLRGSHASVRLLANGIVLIGKLRRDQSVKRADGMFGADRRHS